LNLPALHDQLRVQALLVLDPAFARQLARDPAGALAGRDLPPDLDLAPFARLDLDRLASEHDLLVTDTVPTFREWWPRAAAGFRALGREFRPEVEGYLASRAYHRPRTAYPPPDWLAGLRLSPIQRGFEADVMLRWQKQLAYWDQDSNALATLRDLARFDLAVEEAECRGRHASRWKRRWSRRRKTADGPWLPPHVLIVPFATPVLENIAATQAGHPPEEGPAEVVAFRNLPGEGPRHYKLSADAHQLLMRCDGSTGTRTLAEVVPGAAKRLEKAVELGLLLP
jgi:hypothetical protein